MPKPKDVTMTITLTAEEDKFLKDRAAIEDAQLGGLSRTAPSSMALLAVWFYKQRPDIVESYFAHRDAIDMALPRPATLPRRCQH